MKTIDLINNVIKSEENECFVEISYLANKAFDIDVHYYNNQDRLKSYYIGNWYCTDSTVGYLAYFLDDKPVAVSSQLGRKCDEEFEWLSKEAYNLVYNYVLSFLVDDEIPIQLLNLDEEQGDTYKIEFYEQLFSKHKENAIYKNQKTSIINYKKSYNDGEYHPETVEISLTNGETTWVQMEELDFPYHINKNESSI